MKDRFSRGFSKDGRANSIHREDVVLATHRHLLCYSSLIFYCILTRRFLKRIDLRKDLISRNEVVEGKEVSALKYQGLTE